MLCSERSVFGEKSASFISNNQLYSTGMPQYCPIWISIHGYLIRQGNIIFSGFSRWCDQ